jgi:hypothetical protein
VFTVGIDFKILHMEARGEEKIYYFATIRDNRTQQEVHAFNRWGSWMFTDAEESFMRDMNVGIAAALQERKRQLEREAKKLAEMGWG